MSPGSRLGRRLRLAGLTLHVLASVGWTGAVVVYLALAVAGVTSDDEVLVRGAYAAMGWADSAVLVPLALASLVSGVVQGLATRRGLLLHWWVVVKLVLTVLATAVLLAYTRTLGALAEAASTGAPVAELRSASVVLHSGAALAVLVVTTLLATYKPRGVTRRGWRRQQQARQPRSGVGTVSGSASRATTTPSQTTVPVAVARCSSRSRRGTESPCRRPSRQTAGSNQAELRGSTTVSSTSDSSSSSRSNRQTSPARSIPARAWA